MTINSVGDNCCGCRTCEIVCPTHAISIQKDAFAFEMPIIDKSKCVDCGKCVKVCPVLNKAKVEQIEHLRCGMAYALDMNAKSKGSSGGLFGLFAKNILVQGGIVYGAAFDQKHQLKTTCATNYTELEPLYKSKYLLCNTNGEFVNIKKFLDEGKKVLYCSSPCQLAALKLYLHKEYDNLFLVEFVCHGVGSQEMFNKSIAYIEQKESIKIKKVILRYKKNKGASSHYYQLVCEKNNKEYTKSGLHLTFPYYNAYGKRLVCRNSCFDCKFAAPERIGDITIGDFHTIEKFDKTIDRFAGISMFVCNTIKGIGMLQEIQDKLFVKEMPWETILKENRFSNEEKKPIGWDDFLTLSMDNYPAAVDKYMNPYKDWRYYYYKFPAFLRNWGKKIFKV